MSCCDIEPLYTLDHGKPLTQGPVQALTKTVAQTALAAEEWTPGLILALDSDDSFKPWDGASEDAQLAVLRCCVKWDGVKQTQESTLVVDGAVFDSLLSYPGQTVALTETQKSYLQVWGLTVIPCRDLSKTTGSL